ncbi:UDP-N-acetylglucosamine 1-carboxyvinyltransferase [Clostridia bacterium]|nr:UDP-N-acetylglucosamine 1-carboxyvinyltransferase [Clostridia bacterium]
MERLKIVGGRPIHGELAVHGAKNSVLPLMAATIAAKGECVLDNCPNLRDVRGTARILRHLGCGAELKDGAARIDTAGMNRTDIPEHLMREMRSSFIFLGPILARMGQVSVSYPGGCNLGQRPIDLHLEGFRKLGAEIREDGGTITCKAAKLRGADIHLSFPSVGATENLMIAAATAEGRTTITNAACEPEIVDLQDFLNELGAKVSGAGCSTVYIEGVQALHGARHRVIADRIVAATYLAAAAATGGEITLTGVTPGHIGSVLNVFGAAGCEVTRTRDSIHLRTKGRLIAPKATIHTRPHPGFPTDAQSPIMAMCAAAKGTTIFVENIFENRYRHVGELARMGADIKVENRVAVVIGVDKLYGAQAACTDLRGGAAMVVAALAAEGQSLIGELAHIDRGYENLEQSLRSLGAELERVER